MMYTHARTIRFSTSYAFLWVVNSILMTSPVPDYLCSFHNWCLELVSITELLSWIGVMNWCLQKDIFQAIFLGMELTVFNVKNVLKINMQMNITSRKIYPREKKFFEMKYNHVYKTICKRNCLYLTFLLSLVYHCLLCLLLSKYLESMHSLASNLFLNIPYQEESAQKKVSHFYFTPCWGEGVSQCLFGPASAR